ncbi:hypothetical protein BWQ96_09343 [Gracilariopsis chorda]|uniref:Uncharacterized protein n=1 Tax=Gracilariopsis chorda TaxID=448386 RepID=A0A2V3IFZ2_9FLOR|nr:hypothetical protein BWQ96_09343 [Gracilariopsis chorda]|eukprot:PXF40948.1 hypothetical protein BWQ96_09343 [Gracilariopsis chorda]
MAAPAINAAASSLTVVTLGAAANLLASNKPLQLKSWLPSGGFVGVVNGNGRSSTAVAEPSTPSSPSSPAPKGTVKPIGGRTDKPAPPCPFGRFPKHKPSKLPGPPKPYNPANSP